MKHCYFILISCLLFAGNSSQADVLFLDVNNSPKEVEAAEKAAKKSGRTLVVYPKVDKETKAKLFRLKDEAEKSLFARTKACGGEKRNSPECNLAEAKYEQTLAELKVVEDATSLKLADVEKEIARRERDKKPFSTMIISGHDGTGEFSGTFGEVTDEEISEMLAKYPVQKESLRSLHLWGCYTTSPGSLLNNWLHYFPNMALVSGYDDQAPLNDKPYGWKYLAGVLEREDELMAVTDAQKLQRLLKKIPGASQTHAAIFACGSYASNGEAYELEELANKCDKFINEVKRLTEPYLCYKRAKDPACANPPEQTSQGAVREFYEALHKADACRQLEIGDLSAVNFSLDEVIRLVLFKNVKVNFGNIYQKELAEMDAILDRLGVDPKARFARVGEMSRMELMEAMEALGKYLQSKTGKEFPLEAKNPGFPIQPPPDATPETKGLMSLHRSLSRSLVGLSAFCVPFNWVETSASDRSKCVPEGGFMKAKDTEIRPAKKNKRDWLVPMPNDPSGGGQL